MTTKKPTNQVGPSKNAYTEMLGHSITKAESKSSLSQLPRIRFLLFHSAIRIWFMVLLDKAVDGAGRIKFIK